VSTALLVIDVQAGLFAKKTPILHAEALLANIEALVARARQDGVPVIYIQHTGAGLVQGSEGWQFHPRLQPVAGERIIGKVHPSALKDTPLCDELQRRGVTCLVVTGLVSHGCVRATCLEALQMGYQVVLVADGHSNFSPKAGEIIAEVNEKLTAAGAQVLPAAEVCLGG